MKYVPIQNVMKMICSPQASPCSHSPALFPKLGRSHLFKTIMQLILLFFLSRKMTTENTEMLFLQSG